MAKLVSKLVKPEYDRAAETHNDLLLECEEGRPLAGCTMELVQGNRACFKIRLFDDAYLSVACHSDERWGEILPLGYRMPQEAITRLLGDAKGYDPIFGVITFSTKQELIDMVHKLAATIIKSRQIN